jgi:DNA-binding response OmpR family regulator
VDSFVTALISWIERAISSVAADCSFTAAAIPEIMLTTESQEAKKNEGRAAGARAWITKPFQPSQLVDAVTRLCV